jgi:predicted RNA-binding protein with PUA-like domain
MARPPHSPSSTKRYWLIKSEPETFSLSNLRDSPNQTTRWDGVRNYQARNFMLKEMQIGDPVLFYHSNCKDPGVVGLAEVSSEPYPDPTAFDSKSPYHDPKSDPRKPRWQLVDITYLRTFEKPVTLAAMRGRPELADLLILRKGNRLSITPVEEPHFQVICEMGGVTHG